MLVSMLSVSMLYDGVDGVVSLVCQQNMNSMIHYITSPGRFHYGVVNHNFGGV